MQINTFNSHGNRRELIFISYGYEDEVFALWLARKLAFYGYGVWIDQLEILGGESWVDEVDEALKERSFRVLAVLSKNSLKKPNPKKERTRALQLQKQWGMKDFLITLNLDGTDADWTLSDISWMPFYKGWNYGLRRVLKKLEVLDAPKIHEGNPAIAGLSLNKNEELVQHEPECVYSNWLTFSNLPKTLLVYRINEINREELKAWPGFFLGKGAYGVLTQPPESLADRVHLLDESYPWAEVDYIRDNPAGTVITKILNKVVWHWLETAGCCYLRIQKLHYLPAKFRDENISRFEDVNGKKTYLRHKGTIHAKKPVGPAETIHHYVAIKNQVRQVDEATFILQLTPAVALFDGQNRPITGTKIGPRRKKVTKMWNNGKWRKRFLVFAHILTEQSQQDAEMGFTLAGVQSLQADRMLNESLLVREKTNSTDDESEVDENAEETVDIGLDELEGWIDE